MLKKIILALSLLFFFSTAAYSQLELKPAVGINLTAFSNDPTNTNTSAQLGWQIVGTVSLGDKFYG